MSETTPSPESRPPDAPAAPVSLEPGKRPRRSVGSLVLRAVLGVLLLAALGVAGVVGLFAYYGRDLPSFKQLSDYSPPQTTKVYDRNGVQVAEFFHERRTVVPKEKIPKLFKSAVIAAEDASFYEHAGLDYMGIARAALKNVSHLHMSQGASTITQQIVKNMVLSPEKSVARKVKEAILARRLEQNLAKEDLLYLYVNHIYFGHNRYGVEEAARYFFGKGVEGLSLGEAALLAGLPQSPARLSPINHPDRAKARQVYVLRQMAQNGLISQPQADQEMARPIVLAPRAFEPVGPYYAEDVRRALVERYGEQAVYEGGMRVDVGMDREIQALADRQLQMGLEEVDHRFGWKPSEVAVDLAVLAQARPRLLERAASVGTRDRSRQPLVGWDFSKVNLAAASSPEALIQAVDVGLLDPYDARVVPVVAVDDEGATVDLGGLAGTLPFEQLKWARPYAVGKWTPPPKKPSDVLSPGQLVRVRVQDLPKAPTKELKAAKPSDPVVPVSLAAVPQAQGAVVVLDPETRHVLALSGGYDFTTSAFNRATQARRQPGSSFKPILYAAGLASGRYTPASVLNDAPDLFRDPWTGKEWKPRNFEDNEFDGPMLLRRALARSKNTVAVRVIDAIGAQAVIDMARKAGIVSALPESLTLALGTGEVSPLELANAYATFDALGKRAEPILVAKVTDKDGKVLEEHHAVPEETIPPPVAYVLTSMMRSVIEYERGTAHSVSALKRPVAGKTGTTSDGRDAWFSAFTPDLVTTVWVGFDDHSSMGQTMTGGRAALPIWMGLMRQVLENRPRLDFPMPPGVEVVAIDPETGLRAPDGAPGRQEFFVEGTAPKEFATPPGLADKKFLFLEDGGRERP